MARPYNKEERKLKKKEFLEAFEESNWFSRQKLVL